MSCELQIASVSFLRRFPREDKVYRNKRRGHQFTCTSIISVVRGVLDRGLSLRTDPDSGEVKQSILLFRIKTFVQS